LLDLSFNLISNLSFSGIKLKVEVIDLSYNLLSKTALAEIQAHQSWSLMIKLESQCQVEDAHMHHPAIDVGSWNQLGPEHNWTFQGSFLKNGMRASGKLQFKDGSMYEGEFINGFPKIEGKNSH
jgi:hypothetical protein